MPSVDDRSWGNSRQTSARSLNNYAAIDPHEPLESGIAAPRLAQCSARDGGGVS